MHSLRRSRFGLLAAGSIVLSGLGANGAMAVAVSPPSTASVVTGSAEWYPVAYENTPTGIYLTPQQHDVTGPQRAPFGTSSHQVSIGESTTQTELYRTDAYDGVNLSALTRLAYSTFVRSTSGTDARQPTYLRLSVDDDNDGVRDTSLYFYPANNGTVVNGQWQSWNVSGGDIDVNGDNGGTTTLATYAAAHQNATLVNTDDGVKDAGAIALVTGGNQGGPSDSQNNGEYYVDRVIVGQDDQDTLYDFGGSTETAGATSAVTVDPGNARGWAKQAYDDDVYLGSNQSFVTGPATPPVGKGSLRFKLDSGTNPRRVELFRTPQYDGTPLRDLRTVKFSTFQRADAGNTTPQQPVYLRLSVSDDGTGGVDHTLYYIPANNGAVAQSTWQSWDARTSGKWSVDSDTGAAGTVTLQDYVVSHPDATIVRNADSTAPTQPNGGVAFLVGGVGATQLNGEYFLDNITIGKVDNGTGSSNTASTFDLEPTPVVPTGGGTTPTGTTPAPKPTLSINDTKVSEGNHGATLRFPVTLNKKATAPVTVRFTTSYGTAASGSDFRATTGTVTIPAGSTAGVASVRVLSDMVREASERMTVRLSSPSSNVTVAHATATGTIVNDDTRVQPTLAKATQHRVRATVTTVARASLAPVKVFRVTKSGSKLVLNSHLNSAGHISSVLAQHYKPGTKVTMFATVKTAHGTYRSPRFAVRVGR